MLKHLNPNAPAFVPIWMPSEQDLDELDAMDDYNNLLASLDALEEIELTIHHDELRQLIQRKRQELARARQCKTQFHGTHSLNEELLTSPRMSGRDVAAMLPAFERPALVTRKQGNLFQPK